MNDTLLRHSLEPLENIALILGMVLVDFNNGIYLSEARLIEIVAQLKEASHLTRQLVNAYKTAVQQREEILAAYLKAMS